ncbi:hypothetical protein COOONC_15500 [Cooperia oncophora]
METPLNIHGQKSLNNVDSFTEILTTDCLTCLPVAPILPVSEITVTEIVPNSMSEKSQVISRQEWYQKLMKSGIGRKGGPKMNISLAAAYEYPDQINIVITSRSKIGDVVYCRYFDERRNENGKAFKTMVFPDFNVDCLLREGAAFMSLTDTPDGAYEYPVPVINRTQRGERIQFRQCHSANLSPK